MELFLDLKKGFDTFDHTILLKKLEYFGLRIQLYNGFGLIYVYELKCALWMVSYQILKIFYVVFPKALSVDHYCF